MSDRKAEMKARLWAKAEVTAELLPGLHLITLFLVDSDRQMAQQVVAVTVGQPVNRPIYLPLIMR